MCLSIVKVFKLQNTKMSMTKKRGKKGLSPVIATMLLIVIVVIVALIIFLLFRAMIGEGVRKQEMSADQACEKVELDVSADGSRIDIVNRGDIPVQEIVVKFESGSASFRDKYTINSGGGLGAGEVTSIDTETAGGTKLGETVFSNLRVIPIILGTTSKGKETYECKIEIEVNT